MCLKIYAEALKRELQRQLEEVLQASPLRGNVRRISLFGSHLHGTATRESDIDLLLELKTPISMLAVVRMERELSQKFGRHVDLSTPGSLSRHFRKEVLHEAEPLFESAA